MNSPITTGNVCVLTHSFFSDVVRIGCTATDPDEYAKALSAKSPGEYTVVYALACQNPSSINKQVQQYLTSKKYIDEFYQTSVDVAAKLLKRTTLNIPIENIL